MEPGPRTRRVDGDADQVEGERDGGPATADVVVQIAVQRLEGAIQVGGEGDEEHGGVEFGQTETRAEVGEPVVREPGGGGERDPYGLRGAQQMPYRLLRQVEAAQRVRGRGVVCGPVLHQPGDTVPQTVETGEERGGEGGRGRFVRRGLRGHVVRPAPRPRRAASRASRAAATCVGRCARSSVPGGRSSRVRTRTAAPSVTGGPASYSG